MSVTLFTANQRKHYINLFQQAIDFAESNELITRGADISASVILTAYFHDLDTRPPTRRAKSAKKPALTEEEKAAKAEEKKQKKLAAAAAKAEKKKLADAEKKEWMTPTRFSAESNGTVQQFKGVNGSFLRIQRHRSTGIVRKKVESNWTPEANEAFTSEYGSQVATAPKPNVLKAVASETVAKSKTQHTGESKTDTNAAAKAKLLAMRKKKLAAKAEAEAKKKLATEAEAKKKLAAEAEAMKKLEAWAAEEAEVDDLEEEEIVEDNTQKDTFTLEEFPGLTLYKDDCGMIYNVDGDALVGMEETDGSIMHC